MKGGINSAKNKMVDPILVGLIGGAVFVGAWWLRMIDAQHTVTQRYPTVKSVVPFTRFAGDTMLDAATDGLLAAFVATLAQGSNTPVDYAIAVGGVVLFIAKVIIYIDIR